MPARLHHEPIAQREPAQWLVMTHGLLGSGPNWRGIARKLVERRPEWGVVLVDLRLHGRSDAGTPPHTIAACADDLRALVGELGAVGALAGHSFGGKVMLATRPLVDVRQTWVFDASPGPRAESSDATTTRVLTMLGELPATWARREDFVAAVTARGYEVAFAQWLAMNVDPSTHALRIDLAAMRALIADYDKQDLWPVTLDPTGGDVELVIADRSTTIDATDRRIAHAPAHLHVEHVDAGHWLHIDAPSAVVDLLATRLS